MIKDMFWIDVLCVFSLLIVDFFVENNLIGCFFFEIFVFNDFNYIYGREVLNLLIYIKKVIEIFFFIEVIFCYLGIYI